VKTAGSFIVGLAVGVAAVELWRRFGDRAGEQSEWDLTRRIGEQLMELESRVAGVDADEAPAPKKSLRAQRAVR
jgi:hypothetical protein